MRHTLWHYAKKGDTIVLDGVKYEWCDKGHKGFRNPDGLYMPFPHDHEEWQRNRYKRKNASKKGDSASSAPKSLILSDKMKSALVMKAGFSVDEAKAFIDNIAEGN